MTGEEGGAPVARTEWWLAVIGDTLVWARLSVAEEDGLAEILASSGEVTRHDDEIAARMALLDAEYRAFDGLDEEDALALGFALDEVMPPEAAEEAELLALMVQKLGPAARTPPRIDD